MHSFFVVSLTVSHVERLAMLKEFENNRLLKIVPLPFDKMGFKSAADLPTWKLLRLLRENKENFEFARMLVHEE